MYSFVVHSPVEPLDFPEFRDRQLTVDIKRDDLIHPFISGNKWRKLKYILQDARRLSKSHLVTFGGTWSNHLLATACAGARFGFRTTGFVRGEPVSNASLSLCTLFGMDLRFVDRTSYRNKLALYREHFAEDEAAYFIDEGGYSPEGTRGCGEIVNELTQPYDHIFCAAGTGTTLAGIASALTNRHVNTQLHGVPVLAGGDFLRTDISALNTSPDAYILHTGYHFGGYAKTKPELISFIRYFCAQSGILIEPVYTGKLCYAVFDLARNDYFKPGDRILIIHTGGLVGILGMEEKFR